MKFDINNPIYFLQNTDFTEVEKIPSSYKKILDNSEDILTDINNIVKGYSRNTKFKDAIFRKRFVKSIFASGFITGCTDDELIFATLSRYAGYPVRHVEAVKKDWFENPDKHKFRVHVFVDVYKDNEWKKHTPRQGFLLTEDYNLNGVPYVEIGKGLDFSQLHLRKNGSYDSNPVNLNSFNKIEEAALALRVNISSNVHF